jgi:hypothetical protein
VPCPATRQPPPEVLVGLEVPHAHGGERDHGRLHRAGRTEDDLSRPRQQAVGDLEAGVALSDDEDAATPVVLWRAAFDVVRHLLDPEDRRLPGLGHADGEDGRPAPVLAVRGREHERSVVGAARPFPAAAVADADGHALGEGGQARLHLGA